MSIILYNTWNLTKKFNERKDTKFSNCCEFYFHFFLFLFFKCISYRIYFYFSTVNRYIDQRGGLFESMQRSATFGYRLTTTLYGTKATRDTFSKVRFTVKKFHVERVNFIPLRVNNSSINQQYMYTYPRNQFSYTELFHLLSNLSFLFLSPPFYISIFAHSFVLIIFSRTSLFVLVSHPRDRSHRFSDQRERCANGKEKGC